MGAQQLCMTPAHVNPFFLNSLNRDVLQILTPIEPLSPPMPTDDLVITAIVRASFTLKPL